jgi:hypothetical protein
MFAHSLSCHALSYEKLGATLSEVNQLVRALRRVAAVAAILLTIPIINVGTADRLILTALLLNFRQTTTSLSITVVMLQDSHDAVSLYLS